MGAHNKSRTYGIDHRLSATDRTAFMTEGSCNYEDPDLFFPIGEGDPEWGEAKRVCHRCPVEAECLEYALDMRIPYGVWGGTDEGERKQILRNREPARMKARVGQ